MNAEPRTGQRVVVLSSTSRRMSGWTESLALLRDAGLTVVDPGEDLPAGEALASLLDEADALLIGTNPIPADVINQSPRLRVIGKPGIGVENVDLDAATRQGVVVCNTPGSNAEATADHTFGLLLAATRRIPYVDHLMRAGGGWSPWPFVVGGELPGKVLGIVGLGAIGRAVARRASGFGLRLLACDPAPTPDAATLGVEMVDLETLLRQSDVVSLHVPLDDSTAGLIGAAQIALMKPSAYLVNTARGPVVDEAALVAALQSGRLAGAALDVFDGEPLPTSPLLALDNLVLTPHVGGFSPESSARGRVMAATSIVQVLRGERPAGIVNPDALTILDSSGGA